MTGSEMDKIDKINRDFVDLFAAGKDLLKASNGEVVNRFREDAFNRFMELGGVPVKGEDYKYSDLEPIFDRDYKVVLKNNKHEVDNKDIFTCDVPDLLTNLVLTENGWFLKEETPYKSPKGVIACSLAEASKEHTDLFEKYYNRHITSGEDNSLVALNSAFAQDGLFLYIPDGVVMDIPLQMVNILRGDSDIMSFQRNLIILGKSSKATILACDHTLSNDWFLSNNLTEVVVEENAYLDYYQVQNQHMGASQINSIFASQRRNSHIDMNVISLYGGFIRNNIYISLTEEGCSTNLYGIYLSDKRQKVDNFTSIDHQAPNCISNEHFKGVLDDSAVANFSGRVIVRPGAQKTEAYQSNDNLLLTDTTRVNSKPQLVIDADDVKCSHGATVGQMDEDAMFYLRSRGIGAEEARLMMMFGFAHEIIEKVKLEPLRDKIDDLVNRRLRGELTKCHNCTLQCKH